MLKNFSDKAIALVAGLFLIAAIVLHLSDSRSAHQICSKAQQQLHHKEKQALDALDLLNQRIKNKPLAFNEELLQDKPLLDKEGIVLLVYRNDSLKIWTSTLAPMDVPLRNLKQLNGLLHLRNGWYEYFESETNETKSLALLLLKPEYDVQNSYFKNTFVSWLDLPINGELKFPPRNPELTLKSCKGSDLFELALSENSGNNKQNSLPVILFFTALILFCFILIKYCFKKQISLLQFLVLSLSTLVLRSLMIYFKFPELLYSSSLYDLNTYGITQSFFNEYLGDVLINVILFFAWTIIFYQKVNLDTIQKNLKLAAAGFYLLVLIILSLQLNSTVKNLVINSTISLDFSSFFNLSFLSFLCLGIVFINGFSITIHIEKLIHLMFSVPRKSLLLFLSFTSIAFTSIYFIWFKDSYSLVEWFWLPLLVAISIAFRKYDFTQSILSAGFRVLIFAIITSWIFGEYNTISEEQNLKHLSDQLSDRQDAFLESEFLKVASKIKKDTQLQKALQHLPLMSSETEQLLRQIYFTRYFEKYNIQLAVFDSLCMPYFKNSDYNLGNHDYFENQIKSGLFTISEDLFFIDSHKSNTRYIGKIEFSKVNTSKAPYTLYVQLEPKQFTDAGSFSELLLDAGQQKKSRYKQFSYGIYKNGILSTKYGKYLYPKFFNANLTKEDLGKYKHLLVYPDKETQLVVTSNVKGFNYYFTANSYYFLFYSFLGIILFVIYHNISNTGGSFFTLNRRIQFFIVSVIFLALTALGVFTVNLVIKKSEEDQSKSLTEKAEQIQNELNSQLFYNKHIDANGKIFTESVLQKYAELFNSDISLYNESGLLFASSRPQLFNAGLSSRFINPLTILHFNKNESQYFITRDQIGSLNYLSIYSALYDSNKQLLGYINLPYFARQSDLEEGVSDYITTLINIYVVLFLVSLFTGLIVSVYITKPLRILQEQLAKISLGKKNEPIVWQSNDEIGRLVNEYNQMLLKLEESALLLAKSEREGAWQEMAKQVAHEIKNPLTPMKLNLQYLQKVVGEEGVDFTERFKRVADSLIEQIDTLAHIANEFSNFAKMPKVNLEEVNLSEVIHSTTELFNNHENLTITLQSDSENTAVIADKNQCLRVFNNLLKNAVQAIPDTINGRIEIVIQSETNSVLVSIKDNGEGISEEMKEKIFVPNFTTKTTGTGLGLAMVKNIMTSFSGDIWFESKKNSGTTFYLRFKKYSEKG